MLLFWFLLATSVSGIQAVCPSGYTADDNGNCLSPTMPPTDHNYAYNHCAKDNAYIRDVANAFMNSDLLQQARNGSYASIWLGLMCTGNTFTSCYWDSGRSIAPTSYSNFAPGHPSAAIGACVQMNVQTGTWSSVDCALTKASYVCEQTADVTVPQCPPYSNYYFSGNCYFDVAAFSLSQAEISCQAGNGHVASIHSEGENSFVRDFAATETSLHLAYIGLQSYHGCNSGAACYYWSDNTPVDYENFGYKNAALGDCASLASDSGEPVSSGKWISSPCTSATLESYVCKTVVGGKNSLLWVASLLSFPGMALPPPPLSPTYNLYS